MYRMVQQTPPKTTIGADVEVNAHSTYISEYAQTKKKGVGADGKGWQVAKDNFGGASFGKGSPAAPNSKDDNLYGGDSKETIRRN